MRRLLALMALALAGSIGSAQAATVITFDDLALDENGGDKISGGFLFDALGNHTHITNGSWGTTNGTKSMLLDDVGGGLDPVTISPTAGGTFSLMSIDVSEAGGLVGTSTTARQVQVTGNLFGGGTVSTLLTLDLNFIDGTTANYFQTFALGPTWTNLSSVVLKGIGATCCGGSGGNYYEIDNLVVNTSTVPEPGTLSLVGLGSAYLVGRRRRSRR